LGLLLRPYSLGHELRLARLGNPLGELTKKAALSLGEFETRPILVEAVLICSQSWDECNKMPWDPFLRFKLALWRHRVRKLLKFSTLTSQLSTFITYRDDGALEFTLSEMPDGPGRGEARIAGCPAVLRLQQFLMIQFGLSEAQAWDYPLGLAKCRWACFMEQEGAVRIYNQAEASLDAYAADEDAKIETLLREQEAKGAARLP
jgi:hypothetical protein